MERTLNIIKHDLWLEPFEEAINGRYRYVLGKNPSWQTENNLYRILLRDIFTLACTKQVKDGY